MNKKPLLAAALALSLTTFAAEPPATQAVTAWKNAGETTVRGMRYLYIVMPRPQNRIQYIAAAEKIHAAEPDAWFFFFDDGEKIDEILAVNQSGDLSRFPAAWMKAHLIGSTSLQLDPKTRSKQWVLHEGEARSDYIATLPCIEGKGGCTE